MRKVILSSCAAAILLLCAPAWATLAIDATSLSGSTPAISGTSFSWSHTVTSSGSNRLLMVFVASVTSTQTCTGVTYNGVAMNGPVIDIRDNGSSELRNYVFWMVNPTTGSNTVAVTYSAALDSGNFAAAMAISFTGANQTYPFRYPAVNWSGPQGLSTTAASNVTDAVSGDIIIGSAVTHGSTITQGSNNTAINTWSAFNFATNTSWATASVAASVATQLTWGQSPSGVYSCVEIAIRPDTDTTSIPFIDHFVGQGFGTQNTIPFINNATTATISGFAVGACTNRLLFVAVEYWTGTVHPTATVSGITFNTTSTLSVVGTKRQSDSSGNLVIEFWAFKAPPNTSANIVATFSASVGGGVMGATSWCNVDQTSTFGTVATAGSAGAAVSTTVVSTATSYVQDGALVDFSAGDAFLPTGAMEWDFNSAAAFDVYGMSQVKKGAASVTMNYTGTTTRAFASAGVGINGVAVAASNSFFDKRKKLQRATE